MTPGQGSMPKDSIKVVPGRSKLRVESSNPVATGTPIQRTSKVKLISPEEAIHLSFGGSQMPLSPTSQAKRPKRPASGSPRHVRSARRTLESQRPRTPLEPARFVPFPPPLESPRPVPARALPKSPRPVVARPRFEAPRPVDRPTFVPPRPVPACPTPEAPRFVLPHPTFVPPRPVMACPTPEAPRFVPPHPTSEVPRAKPALPTSKASRRVRAHTVAGSRKEIVCGLRALSMYTQTVRRRTNPSLLQSRIVEPSSPRALQIRARVKQQTATATLAATATQAPTATLPVTATQAPNATQAVEGTTVEVVSGSKDHGYKEICQSTSSEEMNELFLHRPALHPTWKGRIVDSATSPEFDCEFWAKPASNIRKKADKLSKAMPMLLKAELFPTGHVLNDVFGRTPRLSNVEIFFFPDEKETERVKGEVFEAVVTRNAMIKVDINGTELLICSSKLLDKTSQFLVNAQQKKTEHFLWGFFLPPKNSPALVPRSEYVADMMDLDTECPTPSLALKLIAETQSAPSGSPGKVMSVPPGFEKKWKPALVKLSIQGTSNPESELTGSAGIVRDESGKWVFGYFRCHKNMSRLVAGLLAIYHGLKILWDSGIRRIRLEISNPEIVDALTGNSDQFPKRSSLLDRCKDMILKKWEECDIYLVSKEENSCAEWLASRVEEQPQGLVFFEYPPRALIHLLEKEERLAAI